MPYENGIWRAHRWEDWEIELIDGSLNTIGLLDEAAQMAISWALYGYGEGALALHIASDLAEDLLDAGLWFLRFYRDGYQVRDFMVAKDDRGYTMTTQRTDEYIQIALAPLDQILKNHLCLPENGTGTFAAPELPVDDAFKWIVDHVCGPNAYDGPGAVSRVMAGLTIAADESLGPEETITQAHKMDLYEFLQKYGPTFGVDWRVRLERTTGNANQMVFDTFYPARGLDKSSDNGVRQPVILDDASGETLSARRYRPGVGFANVVIGKAMRTEVRDDDLVALYGRRELLADTDDTSKLVMLLKERCQRLGDEFEFCESEMVEVGPDEGDAQPGDTVTIGNQHLAIPYRDVMIREIKFQLDDEGRETIKIVFGEYEKTLADKLNETRGGGGGSGASSYYDPVRGLKDDADVFVPFSNNDDYIWIKLNTDGHLSATGDPLTNEIMLALDDAPEFAVPAITFGSSHSVGSAATFIRSDATIKLVFAGNTGTTSPDASNVLTISGTGGISVSASGNTLTITGPGVTGFATPAITFGSSHAAGSATTVIRSDATIKLVFAGNSGTAVPSAANTLTISGSGGISISGSGNTLTVTGAGVTGFATPTITFGSSYAAGSATTVIRSDATIKLQFNGNSGSAVPSSGNVLTVQGTSGITVTATGNQLSIAGSTLAHTHGLTYDSVSTGAGQSHGHMVGYVCDSTWGGPGHEHNYYRITNYGGTGYPTSAESSHVHAYDKAHSPTGGVS